MASDATKCTLHISLSHISRKQIQYSKNSEMQNYFDVYDNDDDSRFR